MGDGRGICKRCGKQFWIGYGPDNGGEDLCENCIDCQEEARIANDWEGQEHQEVIDAIMTHISGGDGEDDA